MGFAQELKDFVGAVQAGWKMATPTRAEVDALADQKRAAEQAKDRAARAPRGYSDNAVSYADEITEGGGAVPTEGYNPKGRAPSFMAAPAIPLENKTQVVDAIINKESGGNPNALVYKRSGAPGGSAPLENMTISEVMDLQRSMPSRGHASTAVGGPQFIRGTLQKAVEAAGIDPTTTRYDLDTQRKLASAWLDKVAYEPLKRGQITRDQAIDRIAGQWASVLRPGRGRGRYDGFNRNKASLRISQALPLEDEEELLPTAFAAEGGLIDDDYAGDDEHAGSNPAVRERIEWRNRSSAGDGASLIPAMFNDGLQYLQSKFQLDRSAISEVSPRGQDGVQALARNVGAPNPDDVNAIMSTADPDLPLDKKAIMGWSNYYRYHTSQGNPEAAARGAAAMLMHSRRLSQRAGTLAMVALERGDVKGAANAIKTAYDHIPDGVAIKVNEAGTGGVEYEQVDLKGKSIKGKASVEDLKELAKGMMDGSQWFQTVSAARLPVDKKAQRDEQERKAVERYQGTLDPEQRDSYRQTLNEEQLKSFNALPPRLQSAEVRRHMGEERERARAERFEVRNQLQAEREAIWRGDMKERQARKEDWDIFKEAAKHGRWEIEREQIMTNAEKLEALRARDLDDRNKRHSQSAEARQKRYEEIDRRIMERTRGKTGEKIGVKEAAENRRLSAIDMAEEQQLGAARRDMAIGDDGVLDPTAGQRQRESAVQVGSAFNRIDPKAREIDGDDMTEISSKVTERLKGMKAFEKPEQLWLSQVAAEIKSASGNRLTNDSAIDVVQEALHRPDKEVRVVNGMLQVGNYPPVALSAHSFLALAALRDRVHKKPVREPAPEGFLSWMLRTTPSKQTLRERETRRGESAQARESELRRALGEGWQSGMTIPEMEARLAQREASVRRDYTERALSAIDDVRREMEERRRKQRAVGNIR